MNYQVSIETEPDLGQGAPTHWGEYREWSDDIPTDIAPADARPKNGLFVPSREVLRLAGYTGGSELPPGWVKRSYGPSFDRGVLVRPVGFWDPRIHSKSRYVEVHRYGKWWVIQRDAGLFFEVLVHVLGPFLLAVPNLSAAAHLAAYCSPHAPDHMGVFAWEETKLWQQFLEG
jgi:hypothetical protein